jgi:hypothetical protein
MPSKRNKAPPPKIITEDEEIQRIENVCEAEADIVIMRMMRKDQDRKILTLGESKEMVREVFELMQKEKMANYDSSNWSENGFNQLC